MEKLERINMLIDHNKVEELEPVFKLLEELGYEKTYHYKDKRYKDDKLVPEYHQDDIDFKRIK